MNQIHYRAYEQLKQGNASATMDVQAIHQFPFSKNNMQLCEAMVRELIKAAKQQDSQAHALSILRDIQKNIDASMWQQLLVNVPELTIDPIFKE